MKWAIGGWIMGTVFTLMFLNMSYTQDDIVDVDKIVAYAWSRYVAEGSIQKELLAIKSEDIDAITRFNEISWIWPGEDSEYWFYNEFADTWYFDLELKSSTTASVNLWEITWGDIVFEWITSDDYFNTFVLNYNTTTSENILIEVIRIDDGWNIDPCNLDDHINNNCNSFQKTVFNSSDSSLNGTVVNWLQVYFREWQNWFQNRIEIFGFDVNSHDYRVIFSTLNGSEIEFSYHVEHSWNIKSVANNFIEIDTIWNAIDNFSRIRLEKRITNNIQPNTKYVLFSDWEIAK